MKRIGLGAKVVIFWISLSSKKLRSPSMRLFYGLMLLLLELSDSTTLRSVWINALSLLKVVLVAYVVLPVDT